MINYHKRRYRSMPYYVRKCQYDFENRIFPEWVKPAQVESKNFIPILSHNHEEPELIYMTRGKLVFVCGGESQTLSAGELMIANPFEMHSSMFTPEYESSEYCYLNFDLTLFSGFGSMISEKITSLRCGKITFPHFTVGEVAKDIGGLILELEQLYDGNDINSDWEAAALLSRLMSLLFGKLEFKVAPNAARDIGFINRVVSYIDDHYSEQLTTSVICSALGYNESYFCTCFKNNFGTNFSNYLCDYRISVASDMINNGSMTLSDIASLVGFRDYCYFSRCFKSCRGISPTQYAARIFSSKK